MARWYVFGLVPSDFVSDALAYRFQDTEYKTADITPEKRTNYVWERMPFEGGTVHMVREEMVVNDGDLLTTVYLS